ncbi:hypothetical protein R3P38DRAFT_2777475 [Favolaschia claudopus]|uniref:Uncharacterized protein n=1 Tax=Favolaschia claudopus TaxID=2862362 RepID=A0AAW0BKH9_9AGAR
MSSSTRDAMAVTGLGSGLGSGLRGGSGDGDADSSDSGRPGSTSLGRTTESHPGPTLALVLRGRLAAEVKVVRLERRMGSAVAEESFFLTGITGDEHQWVLIVEGEAKKNQVVGYSAASAKTGQKDNQGVGHTVRGQHAASASSPIFCLSVVLSPSSHLPSTPPNETTPSSDLPLKSYSWRMRDPLKDAFIEKEEDLKDAFIEQEEDLEEADLKQGNSHNFFQLPWDETLEPQNGDVKYDEMFDAGVVGLYLDVVSTMHEVEELTELDEFETWLVFRVQAAHAKGESCWICEPEV